MAKIPKESIGAKNGYAKLLPKEVKLLFKHKKDLNLITVSRLRFELDTSCPLSCSATLQENFHLEMNNLHLKAQLTAVAALSGIY
jgi:hypothetical protein